MVERIDAKNIEPMLKKLIDIAATVEPNLSDRLKEIDRWAGQEKAGFLTSRKFLMAFLAEIIEDAQIWLTLQENEIQSAHEEYNEECQQRLAQEMTPPLAYWYSELFPLWFRSSDRKFSQWKNCLKSGKHSADDATELNLLVEKIQERGGNVLCRKIIDFSMSTDLIVSGRQSNTSLCVQITKMGESEQMREKIKLWEKTLKCWDIKRGLFVSLDPANFPDSIQSASNLILFNSDRMKSEDYKSFSF